MPQADDLDDRKEIPPHKTNKEAERANRFHAIKHNNPIKSKLIYDTFRGSHISLRMFSCGFSILVELEFGDVVFFFWREENRRTRRKNLAGRRQPTTNSNHTWHRVGIEPGLNWWKANAFSAPLNYTEPQKPRKRSQAKNIILSDWLGQDVRVQQIKHT